MTMLLQLGKIAWSFRKVGFLVRRLVLLFYISLCMTIPGCVHPRNVQVHVALSSKARGHNYPILPKLKILSEGGSNLPSFEFAFQCHLLVQCTGISIFILFEKMKGLKNFFFVCKYEKKVLIIN